MLILNNDDIRSVLDMDTVISALRGSYQELIENVSVCRPNISTNIPIGRHDAFFKWSTMEGGSSKSGYFAMRVKNDIWHRTVYGPEAARVVTEEWYSTKPGKYCGLIFLVNIQNAEIVAIMNDSHIQRSRVGADGGIGADLMANDSSEVLGVLGSGGMARTHVAAMMCVRNINRIQVFSPTKEHREKFVAELRDAYQVEAEAMSQPEMVFKGADIVAGCTDGGFLDEEDSAAIVGRWLDGGTHVTSIGGAFDKEAMRRTDVALRFGNAPAPVGLPEWGVPDEVVCYGVPVGAGTSPGENEFYVDSLSRRARGEMIPDKTIYLTDLLSGVVQGRTDSRQITFSERGNLQGAQFHAVASKVYEAALQAGVGRELPTEWFLQDERN